MIAPIDMKTIYHNSSIIIPNESTTTSTYNFGEKSNIGSVPYSNVDGEIKIYEEYRNSIINQYKNEILTVISQDEFVDGETSHTAVFIQEAYKNDQITFVREALMQIFLSQIRNDQILEGILVMISSVPYETVEPQGPVIALGTLQHHNLELRDRAIQCYEKWNSKKGLNALKSLNCYPKWLQRYVDKVIMYIERDGID